MCEALSILTASLTFSYSLKPSDSKTASKKFNVRTPEAARAVASGKPGLIYWPIRDAATTHTIKLLNMDFKS